ncbi:MAG: acyltransferase [Candidatus Magnetomorum sp.]|nr:acyltransferase [Candidatus Magnetomorum sp.]
MLHFLPGFVKGIMSVILYFFNTVLCASFLIPISLIKFIIPHPRVRKYCNIVLDSLATCWISVNSWNIRLTKKVRWHVSGIDMLDSQNWYLVISNHQSWVDILVLQKVFNHQIPFLKFFLKKELIWVPILGLAWWGLDFPFMKRYPKSLLKKKPHLKGKDIEITRRACSKFKDKPVSVMNFVEGTRFTPEKHEQQSSPYKNLLKPKSGGIAFVLAAMGDHIQNILNVTIVYPGKKKSFWQFVCGDVNDIIVSVEVLPVYDHLIGDYFGDQAFKQSFQNYLNQLWAQKDNKMNMLKDEWCMITEKALQLKSN